MKGINAIKGISRLGISPVAPVYGGGSFGNSPNFTQKPEQVTPKKSVIDIYFSKPRTEDLENVPIGQPNQKKYFPEISKANLGDEIYLVARTENLVGKKLKIEIRQAFERQITDKDKPIVFKGQDRSGSITITVGKGVKDKDEKGLDYFSKYANANKLENFAWKSLVLTPETDYELEKWEKAVENSKDKKLYLYFHAEVLEEDNSQITFLNPNKSEGIQNFGNSKGSYFELETSTKCFCNRDFTEEEIRKIYKNKSLFSAKNCPLPYSEKSYKSFTDNLNKAMKEYNIDTCLRKAHFLVQIQVESDELNTTKEYADGWDYDHTTHYDDFLKYQQTKLEKYKRGYNRYKECIKHGHDIKGYGPKYKGRGLLQLTWKDTYESYFEHIEKDFIEDPEIISRNLSYTCNSAAWYWKYQSKWGDLNLVADRDDIYYINIGVNGGFNHFKERIEIAKSILSFMKVSQNCEKTKNLGKKIGKYSYELSNIKNYKYGKNHKNTFTKFDDK